MPTDPAIPAAPRRTEARATAPPDVAARRFHWAMVVLLFLSNVGTHVDARNHAHHGFEIESFFVAPHYLLYGTWLMIAGLVLGYTLWSARQGKSRTEWLPRGYGISALGVALYFLAGGLDTGGRAP